MFYLNVSDSVLFERAIVDQWPPGAVPPDLSIVLLTW